MMTVLRMLGQFAIDFVDGRVLDQACSASIAEIFTIQTLDIRSAEAFHLVQLTCGKREDSNRLLDSGAFRPFCLCRMCRRQNRHLFGLNSSPMQNFECEPERVTG